jgi:hypothetical protein
MRETQISGKSSSFFGYVRDAAAFAAGLGVREMAQLREKTAE